MSKITESARGEECLVRIPAVCNHNPETTVFAHYRLAGTCGMGKKPKDTQGAYACSSCHDEVDRRTHFIEINKQLNNITLKALCVLSSS